MSETEDLRALVEAIPGRTLAAKLRGIMPAIDQRVRDGVRHQDLVDALSAALGQPVRLTTFRSLLARYRRRARAEGRLPAAPDPEPTRGEDAPAPPRVTSRADLARLHEEEVDLEELARIGRDLAKKEKGS